MEVTYTSGNQLTVTDDMKDAFNKDGYVIVRSVMYMIIIIIIIVL